jgi:hypothetical protein
VPGQFPNHLEVIRKNVSGWFSSPLAKGDLVLGISGLDPHMNNLDFLTPENAPTEISLAWDQKK